VNLLLESLLKSSKKIIFTTPYGHPFKIYQKITSGNNRSFKQNLLAAKSGYGTHFMWSRRNCGTMQEAKCYFTDKY